MAVVDTSASVLHIYGMNGYLLYRFIGTGISRRRHRGLNHGNQIGLILKPFLYFNFTGPAI